MKNNITAIIPAAGKPKNTILSNSSLPDAMIPINGKPVIGYIIDDLIERGIEEVVISISKEDNHTEKYVTKKFSTKIKSLIFVKIQTIKHGIVYSIISGIKKTSPSNKILIYLGDTIYKGPLNYEKSFLIISSKTEDCSRWCIVEKKTENNIVFVNKPQQYSGDGKSLCGIYFLNNRKILNNFIKQMNGDESSEISDILTYYNKKDPFLLIEAKNWYDCGNIENYYKAKIDFLKVRNFNSITYNGLYGYITKGGAKKNKLVQEINWFKNLPEDLKIFSPRLVNYTISKNKTNYSLEFYGYQSLADMFIFGGANINIWKSIIQHIFSIVKLFNSHKTSLPYDFYHSMYYQKTLDRINELCLDPWWEELFSRDTIEIDGINYKNIRHFIKILPKLIQKTYTKKDMAVIHGDLCLSNILFDPGSKLMKLIDPRGNFGGNSIYGDTKYDIAKLHHSFSGFYDFIVSDLFKITETKSGFCSEIYIEDEHIQIKDIFDQEMKKNGYNENSINFIEALLFISMIPLHSDNKDRQIMMYIKATRLIQSFL